MIPVRIVIDIMNDQYSDGNALIRTTFKSAINRRGILEYSKIVPIDLLMVDGYIDNIFIDISEQLKSKINELMG